MWFKFSNTTICKRLSAFTEASFMWLQLSMLLVVTIKHCCILISPKKQEAFYQIISWKVVHRTICTRFLESLYIKKSFIYGLLTWISAPTIDLVRRMFCSCRLTLDMRPVTSQKNRMRWAHVALQLCTRVLHVSTNTGVRELFSGSVSDQYFASTRSLEAWNVDITLWAQGTIR